MYQTHIVANIGGLCELQTALVRPLLVVLDVELDRSCGIELARRLRNAGCTIPVIFMTGDCDNESNKMRAHEIGCVAFFYKLSSADALVETLLNIARP